jgi:ParB family transcriptional regulator, chromosome partitioning protein
MARRRLSPLPSGVGDDLAPHTEPSLATEMVPRAERAAAPIARVAADAAAASALEEMAEALRSAREEGRLLLDLPLGAVVADHLARDRVSPGAGVADEDMETLIASIRAHGQRTPIEVTALVPGPDGPRYGLISGWRRLAALTALEAETGEPRFATVRALVLRPESAEDAYLAMVEENEIRLGLSQYERARIALLAAERGVFPDPEAALGALFATASKAKRSRIRSFLDLVRALDGTLRFPRAIPERLGLRLVERLREGQGGRIAAALVAASPATPAEELALLERLVAPSRPAGASRPAPEPLLPGVTLATRLAGRTLTLTLKGRGVGPDLEAAVRAALAGLDRPR